MASGNKASKLAFGFRVLKVLGFRVLGERVLGLGFRGLGFCSFSLKLRLP